jgi:hypothetical protein
MIFLRVLAIPVIGLFALMFRTKTEQIGIRAEAERLAKEHQGHQALMDRYLDSRDGVDDDVTTEWIMTDDPVTVDASSSDRKK